MGVNYGYYLEAFLDDSGYILEYGLYGYMVIKTKKSSTLFKMLDLDYILYDLFFIYLRK